MARTIQIRLQFNTDQAPHPSTGMIGALEWMGTTTSAIEEAVGKIDGIDPQTVAVHSWAEDSAPLLEKE